MLDASCSAADAMRQVLPYSAVSGSVSALAFAFLGLASSSGAATGAAAAAPPQPFGLWPQTWAGEAACAKRCVGGGVCVVVVGVRGGAWWCVVGVRAGCACWVIRTSQQKNHRVCVCVCVCLWVSLLTEHRTVLRSVFYYTPPTAPPLIIIFITSGTNNRTLDACPRRSCRPIANEICRSLCN